MAESITLTFEVFVTADCGDLERKSGENEHVKGPKRQRAERLTRQLLLSRQYGSTLDLVRLRPTKDSEKLTKPKEFAVSYSSGNTSNMSTHLKRKHPEITLQKSESKSRNPTAEQAKAKSQTASNLTSTPGQLRLHEVMQSKLSQNSPTNIPLNPTF